MVDSSADDDAFCRANNVAVGSTITSVAARTETVSAPTPTRANAAPSETAPSKC